MASVAAGKNTSPNKKESIASKATMNAQGDLIMSKLGKQWVIQGRQTKVYEPLSVP